MPHQSTPQEATARAVDLLAALALLVGASDLPALRAGLSAMTHWVRSGQVAIADIVDAEIPGWLRYRVRDESMVVDSLAAEFIVASAASEHAFDDTLCSALREIDTHERVGRTSGALLL